LGSIWKGELADAALVDADVDAIDGEDDVEA